MPSRVQRTITIWDHCECGKLLHSIREGERGVCGPCHFKAMPNDTKSAMNRLISAAFRPTTEDEKGRLIDDAFSKLRRDEGHA